MPFLSRSMAPLSALAVLTLFAASAAVGQTPLLLPAADTPREAQRTEVAAARMLSQATLGPTLELIAEVEELGAEGWIDRQLELPATYHLPINEALLGELVPAIDSVRGLDREGRQLVEQSVRRLALPSRRFAWWQAAMEAPDQLRQRVAFALSEVFVVSDQLADLRNRPRGLASYYDVLVRHALGNYRDLLRDVTLHPAMGVYLSHLNNARSDPETGRFPDENYARESMQLFSIGLWELEADGSHELDPSGASIPTYTNAHITEMAKIFTGLGPGGEGQRFGELNRRTDFTVPMEMYEELHEPGEKHLLNGFIVPAGQTGMEDIEAAVDHLFHHPNVGPFIGLRLIQRLVTSNPSPEYLARISAVFADNGAGTRGDLGAVVRAILLDPEARELRDEDHFGHLQEPWLRYVGLLRAIGASSTSGLYLNVGERAEMSLLQHPLSAPSVFNFFSPDFRPNGPIAAAGLAAPEFQITHTASAVTVANLFNEVALRGQVADIPLRSLLCLSAIEACIEAARCEDDSCRSDRTRDALDGEAGQRVRSYLIELDLEDEIALAADVPALIDRLDLLLAYGSLSSESREVLIDTLSAVENREARARLGIYLTVLSPEAAVAD